MIRDAGFVLETADGEALAITAAEGVDSLH
jgi:hypothetical protein